MKENECAGCPGQGIDCADECIKPKATQETSEHPADSSNPCDDCGHSGEGCESDPEIRCAGWIPEPAQTASSRQDALQRDYDMLRELVPTPDDYLRLNRIWRGLAEARKELSGLDEQINLRIKAEQEAASLHAQLSEWNRIKALFREEAKYRSDVGSRNPYHGHAHDIPGIWDSDNGPLAGHECAACAAARAALASPESKEADHA